MSENIVSIVVTSPMIGSIIQQWTLTDDEYAKFEAWVQYAYPQEEESLPDSIRAWEAATIQGTVDNVNRTGAQKAAADAVAGITPIAPQMESRTEK